MVNKIKKAVIPAAGFGSRFLPATKSQPKEMLPIVDKPTLQYIIEECVEAGIEEIIIITGRNKHSIEDHFDKSLELEMQLYKSGNNKALEEIRRISNMAEIHYIRQKEPKGLGHAIYCAKTFIGDEPFAVLLGDDIVYNEGDCCIKQLMNCFNKYNKSILGVQTVPLNEVSNYGIMSGELIENRVYVVDKLIEKPLVQEAPSNLAILGRYIITPGIFEVLRETKPGINGEIQLTDALIKFMDTEGIYAYNFIGKRYDIGNKIGFLKANIEFALRNAELKDEIEKYLKSIIG